MKISYFISYISYNLYEAYDVIIQIERIKIILFYNNRLNSKLKTK